MALGGGEAEGEGVEVAIEVGAEVELGGVLVVLPGGSPLKHGHLDGEEFTESKALACAFNVGEGLGGVKRADAVSEGLKALFLRQPTGDGVGKAIGELLDGMADGAADGALAESLRARVDGEEAAGAHEVRVEGLVLGRVRHLQASPVNGNGAGDGILLALLQPSMHPRHVEPDEAEGTGAVGDDGLAAAHAPAVAELAGFEDRAYDGLGETVGLEVGDAADIGEVAEAAGEEEGGIAGGRHAELLEALGGALADARQSRHGVVGGEGTLPCARGGGRGDVTAGIRAGGGDGALQPLAAPFGSQPAVATATLEPADAFIEGVSASDDAVIDHTDEERVEAAGDLAVRGALLQLAFEDGPETGKLGRGGGWRRGGGQPYGLRRTAQIPRAFGPR